MKPNPSKGRSSIAVSDAFKHRLAERKTLPLPGEQFEGELNKLCEEIRDWKEKLETSTRVQLAAKLGRRPNFSEEATAENIKDFLTDDTGKTHLKILKKDPGVYASRIAVVVSTIHKGSGLSDHALKKILIQAAAGNYNTQMKIEKIQVDNISSVNLRVVLRVQSLYFDAYIRECKRVIVGLKSKIEGFKDDVYKQQRDKIRGLTEKIQSNALIINEYKQHAVNRGPSEKEKNIAYAKDILLNLSEFDEEKIDEKRMKVLRQSVYNIVQVIRGCTLLYPLGHRIADKVIKHGKYEGEEHPIGYFLKGQLYADEYLLAFKGMEKSVVGDKEYFAQKIVETFKQLSNYYNLAYGKIGPKTDPGLQAAIAIDFSEYLINFYEVHKNFLIDTLKMKPLSREWLNPLLNKTKNGLMAIDSSARVEDLYVKLENIGIDAGIPQY
ncbi:MAG: hypothetical protein HQM13_08855 [SAR324 cluster bacterium]|nr:hypothetical protein [SAR324 cluster bacterium]